MPNRSESQTKRNHKTMDTDRQRLSSKAEGVTPPVLRSRWRSSMVEQLICNQQVAGSSPIASSLGFAWAQAGFARRSPSRESSRTLPGFSRTIGRVPEWPKGTDCKSVVSDFEGSNPSPSTSAGRTVSSAGVAQLVELQPSKLDVAGSRPVSRSISKHRNDHKKKSAHVAQLAEHVLGKDEVTRSIRVVGSLDVETGDNRVGAGGLCPPEPVAGRFGNPARVSEDNRVGAGGLCPPEPIAGGLEPS